MGDNKLAAVLAGKPVVRHVVEAVAAAGLPTPIVVLGHDPDAVRVALEGLRVRFVEAADHAHGMGHSLAAGISAVPEAAGAALVCLGDMPLIAPALLRLLCADAQPAAIVMPVHDGRRGHPIVWGRDYFGPLRMLQGDVGARHLLARHADAVHAIAWHDASIHADIDTPEALARAEAWLSRAPVPGSSPHGSDISGPCR